MLLAQELIELSTLIVDKDPVLSDKIIKLNNSVALGIVNEVEAEGLIELAKGLVRAILFPVTEIEAPKKTPVPVTLSDLVTFQKEYNVTIKPNSVTKKYDVLDVKGIHRLEFEFDADFEDLENHLKVL